MNHDLHAMSDAELVAERQQLRMYVAILATRRAKITEILTQRCLGESRESIGVTTGADGTITADSFDPVAGHEAIKRIAESIQSHGEARDELGALLDEHGITEDDEPK